ncbi:MAG: 1,4-alpha-glucan branching protein GlgB [Saprospiraceae bacterium]|nr:1,4-alpha-glucan branching protein GlgB [Saprospiraceae bacterium]
MSSSSVKKHSLMSEFDIYLFKAGKHFKLYEKLGAHLMTLDGEEGCFFAVYAPAADGVAVVGDFNNWDSGKHFLHVRFDSSGIWEGFIPGVKKGDAYKFKMKSSVDGGYYEKADPYARHTETPPHTASKVWDSNYQWGDSQWMKTRKAHNELDKPYSIYEVHLGSWKKKEGNQSLTYQDHADQLVSYVKEMGFTHVELLPIMEHPYEPSWGYQVTGFFAPTSRFGAPEDMKYMVDRFHQEGIGVILDWVPAHFPSDAFALARFDGSHVYEHPDLRKGYHPDWRSLIFNFERNEIRSFLISSAMFWMGEYHADSLRVDAVASMLYLDYSREQGEWEPNEYGGNENLAAVSFIKDFNAAIYANYEGTHTIAEESTAFSGVTNPVDQGGLGFGMKWMMGWMHDTLNYFGTDPIFRKYHQNNITFSIVYAFSENFCLPLSHDEVVHGKGSIMQRMPGDEWQRFANLRCLYSYMFTHPGTKLLFMGNEIGQYDEWNFKESIQWNLLEYKPHKGLQTLVKDLNKLYKEETALSSLQFDPKGFEWVDFSDHEKSIITYLRKGNDNDDALLVVCNFTPESWKGYRIGVPQRGTWSIVLNSDDEKYYGSGFLKSSAFESQKTTSHGRMFSIEMDIPPMAVVVLKLD